MEPQPSQIPQSPSPTGGPHRFPLVPVLLSLLVLLLFCSTAYLAYQNLQLNKQVIDGQNCIATGGEFIQAAGRIPLCRFGPQPTPTPMYQDQTQNWKTYTNATYHFSIKYPESWFINDCGTTNSLLLNPKAITICETEPYEPVQIAVNLTGGFGDVFIAEWQKNGYKATSVPNTITGIPIEQYSLIKTGAAPGPDKFRIGLIPLNGTGTQKGYIAFYNFNLTYSSVFDQILSTFKFLDTNTPAPTCTPRPACLDATPRCMIPETSDMCPKGKD